MNKRIIQTVCVIFSVFLLFIAGGTPALAGRIEDGKMSVKELRVYGYIGRSVIWHFDGRQWFISDPKAPEKTNTLETIHWLGTYWIENEGMWFFYKGSTLLWSYVKYKTVEDLTKQRFEAFGNMSIDEIVKLLWKEARGKEAPILAVSSLDNPDFSKPLKYWGIRPEQGETIPMYYSSRRDYFTFPPREDRARIVEAKITYKKKSLSFYRAILALAHEYVHDELGRNWRSRSWDPSFQEKVAYLGAATVIGQLQEKYGVAEEYDEQTLYGGWIESIGTEEMQQGILAGYPPSANSMVSLFKSLFP